MSNVSMRNAEAEGIIFVAQESQQIQVCFIALTEFCCVTYGRRHFSSIDSGVLSKNLECKLQYLHQVYPLSVLPSCGRPGVPVSLGYK